MELGRVTATTEDVFMTMVGGSKAEDGRWLSRKDLGSMLP